MEFAGVSAHSWLWLLSLDTSPPPFLPRFTHCITPYIHEFPVYHENLCMKIEGGKREKKNKNKGRKQTRWMLMVFFAARLCVCVSSGCGTGTGSPILWGTNARRPRVQFNSFFPIPFLLFTSFLAAHLPWLLGNTPPNPACSVLRSQCQSQLQAEELALLNNSQVD